MNAHALVGRSIETGGSSIMRSLLVLFVAAAACGSITDPAAIDPLPCTATVRPDSFRLIYRATVGHDTTPWTTNRVVVPHRYADTLIIGAGEGRTARLIFTNPPGQCRTLLDSLVTHTPGNQIVGWILGDQ